MSSSAAGDGPRSLLDVDDRALLEELAGTIPNDRLEALADTLEEIHRDPQLDELDDDDHDQLVDLVEVVERPRLDVDERELLDDDPARYKRSTLPEGKLPGFGEPGPYCGQLIPEALFGCPQCGASKNFPHNCYEYDCPMHGLHAVRRRAKGQGNTEWPGLAPELGAIRAVLDYRRDIQQVYQHYSLSPPPDFLWISDDGLDQRVAVGQL